MKVVSKFHAAAESAARTFAQTAVPAFVGTVTLSRPSGISLRDFVVAAAISASAAGLSAALRIAKPLSTDAQSVGVAGVKP
jgi:hypothetical protein